MNREPKISIDKSLDNTIVSVPSTDTTLMGEDQVYLRIIHPRERAARYLVTADGVVLGRGAEADVVITDAQVSRRHCSVSMGPRGVIVQDLGSTNGTTIDGTKIKHDLLSPGSRLKIGDFVLRVEYRAHVEINEEDQLQEAVRTDELTGTRNRRWFFEHAAKVMGDCVRQNFEVSFVMIDIDRFKQVNDTFGHAAGDAVLKNMANILLREKRPGDLLARFGGEEFIMLLPNTGSTDAMVYCDRLRETVEQSTFTSAKDYINVHISVGVCSRLASEYQSIDQAIGLADAAMYRAKKSGRNRVSE